MVDTRNAWRLTSGTTRLSPFNDENTFFLSTRWEKWRLSDWLPAPRVPAVNPGYDFCPPQLRFPEIAFKSIFKKKIPNLKEKIGKER